MDILIGPAISALDYFLNEYKDKTEEKLKFRYKALLRSKKCLEHLNFVNIKYTGKTIEELDEELKNKNNLLLLTDKEVDTLNKAMEFYTKSAKYFKES